MVYGPRGAPGCLPASTPWFTKFFFAVIVAIATTLAPIGWPNIDNVTCLLTPSVAYRGASIKRRTNHCKEDVDAGKYPIATTITNLLPITYIVLLIDDVENGRPLPSTFQWQIFYQDRMKTC